MQYKKNKKKLIVITMHAFGVVENIIWWEMYCCKYKEVPMMESSNGSWAQRNGVPIGIALRTIAFDTSILECILRNGISTLKSKGQISARRKGECQSY